MSIKNGRFFVCFSILLSLVGMSLPRPQRNAPRNQISVKGRIIGYSIKDQLRSVQGRAISATHDAFLFLVEKGNGKLEDGTYIKIQYQVTQEHSEDLPADLFEQSVQRSFVLEKDETCDESAESFIYGDGFGGVGPGSEDRKRFPNLILLRGEEHASLPKDRVLRCYKFGREDIG